MKFGLFLEWPNPSMRSFKTLFEEGGQQVQYSEELGFDYCLIAEHHFSNYGNSPSPLLQAAYIGQRTRRIRIGTAVLVLPVWHPLRLAEEVAVLDHLLDGRFICGIGRGYQPYEMGGFDVGLAESRERFNESLDVMVRAWTEDRDFTYEGRYVRVPQPVVVLPKPLQKPHPPLWLAGTSVESLKLAAERDMLPLTSGMLGMSALRSQVAALVQARRQAGKSLNGLEVGLQCMTHVAPTDEEARAQMKYARWQVRAQRALNRCDVKDGRVQVRQEENELDDDAFYDRLFFGSPETVVEKFQRAAEVGVTHVSNWMMFGGIEHEKVMRSIRLMGEAVIPALKEVNPPAGLAERLLKEPPATNEQVQSARFNPSRTDIAT